jgi:hypothetical protein
MAISIPGNSGLQYWGISVCNSEDSYFALNSHRLYVFVYVLGYSRMLFIRFTTSTKQYVLEGCLQEGFGCCGIPRELLVDNMKQVVDSHTREGVRFNKGFLDFCDHYEVTPCATPPYWPRSKGKVERGVGYVKRSFLEGRVFVDLDDLNRQADHWVDTVANVRVHGTTGERPCDRYHRETEALKSYEAAPVYESRPVEVRKVMNDSYIRYGGVFYSVEPVAVGQSVVVKADSDRIGAGFEVYLGSERVAVHRRRAPGSPRVTDPEHGEKIRRLVRQGKAVRGRQVRYLQIAPSWHVIGFDSPEVETRSLDLYEQLLQGGLK